jgi:hypothetical protein
MPVNESIKDRGRPCCIEAAGCGTRGIAVEGQPFAPVYVFVERLWRSLKYEEVYLHAYTSVAEAKTGVGAWLHFYNEERLHQARGYRTPRQVYEAQCPWTWGRSAAPTGSTCPTSRASSQSRERLAFTPRPTDTSINKDLEIEEVEITLWSATTPMPSIGPAP